jgi:hypothetical protein
VVDFFGPYHVILGWPCYAKFMDIPSYTYLKLKIPGPAVVIIMEAKTQWATTELRELCLSRPPFSIGPTMPSSSDTFKVAEDAKAVQIDAEDLTQTIQIGAGLSPK